MALSLTSIGNFLFKRAQSKSSTNDGRQFFEETFDGRAPVIPVQIWAQADQIPTTAPTLADGVTVGVVKRYVQLSLTAVPGTTNAFQSDSLRNCIPFNYATDGSYNYTLFDSGGASIPFGQGDWLVDPAVGTVTFYGSVPGNMPPKISFYQYVGSVGMVALNPQSLTFQQIATPPTAPASGYQTIYVGTDGKMKTIDSTGAVKALGGGGGGAAGKNYLADYYDGTSVTGITSYNQATTYTFLGSDNRVDTLGDGINYTGSTFYTGQALTYTASTPIGGLTSATTYYAVRITASVFGLATSVDNAQAKRLIDLTSQGSGTHTFQAQAAGYSGGAGTASSGLTQTVSTSSPLRLPSNIRLSKDASNRLGMNWVIPFVMDRADVDSGKPMKLAFKFRTSANYTAVSGSEDVRIQLYDIDNNLIVPLDTLYSQALPVATVATGAAWQFQPNLAGYNMRLIVDVSGTNALAFDLDFIDFEISSAAGSVPGVFASPMRTVGTVQVGITSGTAPTKGTVVVDRMQAGRVGDYGHLNVQYHQTAGGTSGTASQDYLYSLPAPNGQQWQFDPARVTFNTEAANTAPWNTRCAFVAGALGDGTNEGSAFVVPYDATRFRLGLTYNGPQASRFYHGSVFTFAAALHFSLDVMLPILGFDAGPTYSTSEIALKQTPTSATSAVKSGILTSAYMAMTGNAVTLQPGTYDLGGTVDFNNNGTSPSYTNVTMGWYASNGTDTPTAPTALTTLAGLTILGSTAALVQPVTGAIITTQAPELTIRVTQAVTIYLVPQATATGITSARVTTYALANKRPDYSAFGVYGQVDIRNNGSNTTLPFYQIVTNAVWFPMTTANLNFLDLPVGTWRVMFHPYFGSQPGQNANYQNIAWAFGAATGGNTGTRPAFPNTLPNVIQYNFMNDFQSKDSAGAAEMPSYPIWLTLRVTSGTARIFGNCYASGTNLGQGRIQPFMMAEKLQ